MTTHSPPGSGATPRILVIRGGAIGDFVLTLPALSALRRQFPQCRLELLAYPHIGVLAQAGRLVDAVLPIESRPLAGFFARGGDLDPGLARYFAGCALVVSYLYDPDEVFQTNVGRCTRAQFIAGPHRPDEEGTRHATEVFLEPLERLAIFGADPVPRLDLKGGKALSGAGVSEYPWVALHPGSGSERKNWPESKWLDLVARLLESGNGRLLLVGGEAEGDRLDRIQERFATARVEVARSLPLVDLAVRLLGCDVFVGHDSGITHLAAALGCPALVLWGPSKEVVWRPRSAGVTVLRAGDGLDHLSVSTVAETLEQLLASL